MAARVTRAKKKIAAARIPYRVPEASELPDRLRAVLAVIHLVYTTGHTDPTGADLMQRDLTACAIDLARMLRALMPTSGKYEACWRCCCSPTPARRRGPMRKAGSCCWRSRIAGYGMRSG